MVQLRDKAGKDELAAKVTPWGGFFGGGVIKFSPALCRMNLPCASLNLFQSRMIGVPCVFGDVIGLSSTVPYDWCILRFW